MDRKVAQYKGLQIPNSKIAIKKKKWNQLRRAHTNKQRKVNIGTWRLKQTISYIEFLQENWENLESNQTREKSAIYSSMASFIKTRTSLQCRSHHQKMMKTHGSINKIVQYYSKVVIPFFQRQEMIIRKEKIINKLKNPISFYQVFILQSTIRIQIDQSQIGHY